MPNNDPFLAYHFVIEIEGLTGYFVSASGLGSETEVTDHKIATPTGREITRRIPGRLKWGDITLKRGVTTNMDFWDWRKQIRSDPDLGRKNGSIYLVSIHGEGSKIIARWDFEKAWPSKITGPDASSDSSEVAMEEVVIVHEGIRRVAV